MPEPPKPLLNEALPGFGDELESLLRKAGQDDLAAAENGLRVVKCCGCRRSDCQTFYTIDPATWPDLEWEKWSIPLEPRKGMIILDVLADRQVAQVEVLGRGDLRPAYRKVCEKVGYA